MSACIYLTDILRLGSMPLSQLAFLGESDLIKFPMGKNPKWKLYMKKNKNWAPFCRAMEVNSVGYS